MLMLYNVYVNNVKVRRLVSPVTTTQWNSGINYVTPEKSTLTNTAMK